MGQAAELTNGLSDTYHRLRRVKSFSIRYSFAISMSNETILPFPSRTAVDLPPAQSQHSSRSLRHGQMQQAISDLIKEIPRGTHLTAPEVYRQAKEAGLQVSLSSVYRALNHLEAHGGVTALGSDKGRRYESADSAEDHDHLICVKCGLTIEFVDDLIRGFGEAVAKHKGFEHKASRFDILGLCGDCKNKDEDHRIENAIQNLNSAIEATRQALELMLQSITLHEGRRISRGQETAVHALDLLENAVLSCRESLTLASRNGDLV